ncbi:MAG: shikimate kinase [Candidatus Bathyarchaeota archaeon]|nr:shikimate kinase [Candidatus Bathyarchaeum tardum]WNZ28809.1 MAG: shikimate kinase [Candidatus Bathyarchaeota archaeon]
MHGHAQAISHGAATIINAIATGKGAAVGVDLWTKAIVKLTGETGQVDVVIRSDSSENPVLAQKTVEHVFKHFGLDNEFGAKVETSSSIPVARGMKSSSAAANAIALATAAALERSLDDVALVRLGVEAALDAKVTITGAFDDACASYFGGVVITDNLEREIIKRFELPEAPLAVLFYVPAQKTYTVSSNVNRMRALSSAVKIAYNEALNGNYWAALTLNGLVYSSVLGYDPSPAVDALTAGALAAGLSGTGPAVTAIVSKDNLESVKEAWQNYVGDILEAQVNLEKARVVL